MSRPPPPPPAKPLAERPPAERESGSGLIGMLRRARWWVAEVISAGSVENASRACSGVGLASASGCECWFGLDLGFDLRGGLGLRLRADSGESRSLTSSGAAAHLGPLTQRILEHITLTQQATTHVDSLLGDPRLRVGGWHGWGWRRKGEA